MASVQSFAEIAGHLVQSSSELVPDVLGLHNLAFRGKFVSTEDVVRLLRSIHRAYANRTILDEWNSAVLRPLVRRIESYCPGIDATMSAADRLKLADLQHVAGLGQKPDAFNEGRNGSIRSLGAMNGPELLVRGLSTISEPSEAACMLMSDYLWKSGSALFKSQPEFVGLVFGSPFVTRYVNWVIAISTRRSLKLYGCLDTAQEIRRYSRPLEDALSWRPRADTVALMEVLTGIELKLFESDESHHRFGTDSLGFRNHVCLLSDSLSTEAAKRRMLGRLISQHSQIAQSAFLSSLVAVTRGVKTSELPALERIFDRYCHAVLACTQCDPVVPLEMLDSPLDELQRALLVGRFKTAEVMPGYARGVERNFVLPVWYRLRMGRISDLAFSDQWGKTRVDNGTAESSLAAQSSLAAESSEAAESNEAAASIQGSDVREAEISSEHEHAPLSGRKQWKLERLQRQAEKIHQRSEKMRTSHESLKSGSLFPKLDPPQRHLTALVTELKSRGLEIATLKEMQSETRVANPWAVRRLETLSVANLEVAIAELLQAVNLWRDRVREGSPLLHFVALVPLYERQLKNIERLLSASLTQTRPPHSNSSLTQTRATLTMASESETESKSRLDSQQDYHPQQYRLDERRQLPRNVFELFEIPSLMVGNCTYNGTFQTIPKSRVRVISNALSISSVLAQRLEVDSDVFISGLGHTKFLKGLALAYAASCRSVSILRYVCLRAVSKEKGRDTGTAFLDRNALGSRYRQAVDVCNSLERVLAVNGQRYKEFEVAPLVASRALSRVSDEYSRSLILHELARHRRMDSGARVEGDASARVMTDPLETEVCTLEVETVTPRVETGEPSVETHTLRTEGPAPAAAASVADTTDARAADISSLLAPSTDELTRSLDISGRARVSAVKAALGSLIPSKSVLGTNYETLSEHEAANAGSRNLTRSKLGLMKHSILRIWAAHASSESDGLPERCSFEDLSNTQSDSRSVEASQIKYHFRIKDVGESMFVSKRLANAMAQQTAFVIQSLYGAPDFCASCVVAQNVASSIFDLAQYGGRMASPTLAELAPLLCSWLKKLIYADSLPDRYVGDLLLAAARLAFISRVAEQSHSLDSRATFEEAVRMVFHLHGFNRSSNRQSESEQHGSNSLLTRNALALMYESMLFGSSNGNDMSILNILSSDKDGPTAKLNQSLAKPNQSLAKPNQSLAKSSAQARALFETAVIEAWETKELARCRRLSGWSKILASAVNIVQGTQNSRSRKSFEPVSGSPDDVTEYFPMVPSNVPKDGIDHCVVIADAREALISLDHPHDAIRVANASLGLRVALLRKRFPGTVFVFLLSDLEALIPECNRLSIMQLTQAERESNPFAKLSSVAQSRITDLVRKFEDGAYNIIPPYGMEAFAVGDARRRVRGYSSISSGSRNSMTDQSPVSTSRTARGKRTFA